MGHNTLLSAILLAVTAFNASASTLFSTFPDAKYPEDKLVHFTPFNVITAIDGSNISVLPVSGKLTKHSFDLPNSYTLELVINNYLDQLKKLNAEILFQCQQEACGEPYELEAQLAPSITVDTKEPDAYVAAKLTGSSGDVYSIIYVSRRDWGSTNVQIVALEIIPEPLGLIEANPAFLQQAPTQVEIKDRRSEDEQGSADHPLLGRMPGSFISDYMQTNFTQVPVITGISAAGYQTQSLDAKVTRISYRMPRKYSMFEISRNYAAAANKLGAEAVFHCKGEACGDDAKLIRAMKLHQDDKEDEWQDYQLFKLSRPSGDVYFDIYAQGYYKGVPADTTVRVMELTALKDDRVVINLDALTEAISQSGKATLEGLLFDYDSDQMLPESKPVLEVLANYLKQHPTLDFYVVGHTDDKGDRNYNQSLSQRRAAAVIKQLTELYQIPASQLTAHGNGEYSPVASNANEAGQRLNRRVELVLRSDKK
ncbi:OmpA family protein [Shewanella sp. C32]|uniref:OmpA family protein n=1 Tax=Shewanella electrica TaxID=515560 RepID=A0ABT2FPB4_9GAMM|nr:OmpA family protein [Shewanella electrica]MCH1926556.1 OmpA family protein [Shewanella electrica]MCS4558177.1 OmpA family protein [Shewanella electrica]